MAPPPIPEIPKELTPENVARYNQQREEWYESQRPEAEALAETQRVDLERRQQELSVDPPPMPDVRFTNQDRILSDAVPIYAATKESLDQRWGFVIYRVSFGDDEAWQRFLRNLKWCVHRSLLRRDMFEKLAPYLQWTIIEDRALDGASQDQVRRHFAAWAKEQTGDPDEPGPEARKMFNHGLSRSPRHRYCLYVDAAAMESAKVEVWSKGLPDFAVTFKDGHVGVVDGWFSMWKAHPEPPPPTVEDLEEMMEESWEQGADAEESEEDPDEGWMLAEMYTVTSLYAAMWSTDWEDLYVPPPDTYPRKY